ncbi:MAG: segregation/condensation protein A [Hellea sp.]|nr:segregation/condensation protein A [Hellea sp.]
MSEVFEEDLKFEAADDAADGGAGLILDIAGYEGPLHLLLELARQQKVDIARISILELAEQYLSFIKSAQDLRIELAADYLVMAAWLAYLKSRLILPRDDEEVVPEADELAAHLAFRLERLEGMRRAADGIFKLPQIGQKIFVRGNPEGLRSRTTPIWEAELFDILEAYGQSRSKSAILNHKIPKPLVMTVEDARYRLRRALETIGHDLSDWTALDSLLPSTQDLPEEIPQPSIRASSLVAGLELAKLGEMELRQTGNFAPIYIRGTGQKRKES